MAEKLVNKILALFGVAASASLIKYVVVFVISLLPILELRGGLIAAALLGLDPVKSYIICIIGNIIPIPIILWFLESVFSFMKKHKILVKFVNWLEEKGNKNKEKVSKYGFFGLVLFVGIPLPGTGAWTGCLAATMLRMDKKKALVSALLGVLLASIIMMIFSYGLIANI